MSSEDDDDEELLQRALAQQAQRDQNPAQYNNKRPAPPQYPAPAPPVPAALGLGPPRRTPPRTPPSRAPPPAPPAMDDDEEESDVELLSISSDEDAPPAPRRESGQREAAKARQPEDESDLEWDDDDQEPENWTDVDQTELVRRVREMRQDRARAAAPVQRLRRAATMDTVPRGEDLADPLGLGLINMKTLTLVRDKREAFRSEKASGSEKDMRRDEQQPPPDLIVRDTALREKIIYHSENFDPKVFLARVHQNTPSSDLEAGESALKVDLQDCKNQLKKLVKENFDCFISCKNTIDDIHSKLQQIEADPEGAGTIHLSNAIQSVDVVAKRAFGPLLERQAQAERIRSVQGMLQRFRTLFNLPSIIRGNINKGEYDLAIREYKKAKSLVQYTHVDILSRVLEEVDKIVLEFKEMLYRTMENPQVDTSQLENTIRLLLELEPDSDPVWHYLSIQDRRIRGLLEGCSLEHEERMDALHGRVQEKALADARWKQLQRESNKASDVDFNLLLGDQDREGGDGQLKESTGEESDALLGRLIRRLTVVFVQHVPNFWHLALLIFSGKFVKVSQPGSMNGRSMSFPDESAMYPYEAQPASTYSKHSMDEVVTMVHCILALYETKVQNAFNGLAEANVLRPHMREALSEITKVSVALEGKDCAPVSAVQALLVLRIEVTRVFVVRLCSLLRGATSEFVYEEDWVPVPTTERGGTPYAISYLPLRFRDMLVTAMEHMTEMIQKLLSEAVELHEDQAVIIREMQDHVRITFVECFLDLSECLDKLAGELSDSPGMEESRTGEGEFFGLLPGSEVTLLHRRLLIGLSNAAFCKTSLLPSLSQNYEPLWTYAGARGKGRGPEENHTSTADDVSVSFNTLEKTILNRYNHLKAAEIDTAAADYLLNDGTQWGQSPAVKGIRDNVVELLHPLITVHAEVSAGAKPFLDQVISSLVEALIVALSKVFTDNKNKVLRLLDVNGYCQLTLELDFVDAVLGRYFTPAAREAAVGLRDMLLEKVCESVSEIHHAEVKGPATRSRTHDESPGPDRGGPLSPDEVQARAHQVSADYLSAEMKRARTNIVCFTEVVDGNHLANGRRMPAMPSKAPSGRDLLQSRNSGIIQSGTAYTTVSSRSLDYNNSDVGVSSSDRYARLQFDSRNDSRRMSHRTVSSRSYDSDFL